MEMKKVLQQKKKNLFGFELQILFWTWSKIERAIISSWPSWTTNRETDKQHDSN